MEIEVGMYVRTKQGCICKILKLNEPEFDDGYLDFNDIGSQRIREKNIVKTSYNIIDLIEVGDYVNGYKVIKIFINKLNNKKVLISLQREAEYEYSDDLSDYMCDESIHIYLENIKSIVTKEQFKSIEYAVE